MYVDVRGCTWMYAEVREIAVQSTGAIRMRYVLYQYLTRTRYGHIPYLRYGATPSVLAFMLEILSSASLRPIKTHGHVYSRYMKPDQNHFCSSFTLFFIFRQGQSLASFFREFFFPSFGASLGVGSQIKVQAAARVGRSGILTDVSPPLKKE